MPLSQICRDKSPPCGRIIFKHELVGIYSALQSQALWPSTNGKYRSLFHHFSLNAKCKALRRGKSKFGRKIFCFSRKHIYMKQFSYHLTKTSTCSKTHFPKCLSAFLSLLNYFPGLGFLNLDTTNTGSFLGGKGAGQPLHCRGLAASLASIH